MFPEPSEEQEEHLKITGEPRDIYYLIFDRHTDARTLAEIYGFDNRPFLNFLRDRGFYVATRSAANYPRTPHSLASSLNMRYFNGLPPELAEEGDDWRPLYQELQDFRVARLLKGLGYEYIHLGSWWEPTATNGLADENFLTSPVDGFTQVFLQNTIVPVIGDKLGISWFDRWAHHYENVPATFAKLKEIAAREEPTFAFAHVLVPHTPYVFDADGRCLIGKGAPEPSQRDAYIGQVRYVNREIRELVDALLRASDLPPIIIIQADEGPFPERRDGRREDEGARDWTKVSERELRQKVRILNADYLPDVDAEALHPAVTPVNTFRIVFNEYFGGSFEILPDRSYMFDEADHLYRFVDVTETVR